MRKKLYAKSYGIRSDDIGVWDGDGIVGVVADGDTGSDGAGTGWVGGSADSW